MTADDFRRIALSMPGAEQGSHMGAVDFRVGGRIFATLASVQEGFGNLMLSREIQADFLAERADVFLPIKGGWGRMGMTHVRLAEVTEDVLAGAIQAAWKLRVASNLKSGAKRRTASAGKAPVVRAAVQAAAVKSPAGKSVLKKTAAKKAAVKKVIDKRRPGA